MNDINSRIIHIIDSLFDGNNSKFSRAIDTTDTTVRGYVARKSSPKFYILVNICKALNISPTWILLGEGEMLKDTPPIENESKLDSLQKEIEHLKSEAKLKDEIIALLKKQQS